MSLFGPVFYFDLLRQTRRRLPSLVRLLYLAALLVILLLARWVWAQSYRGGDLPSGQVARFIESFFSTFIAAQFFFVCALVPALTAGAITEEKEGQTLPFLLASSLRNHEIILGKLAARLTNILLIVIAGLPVFSLLQLLGGVDPAWLTAGFLCTGATMLSLAAVSIYWSTVLSRSRDAVLFSYLSLPVYLVVIRMLPLGLRWLNLANFPSTDTWYSPFTLGDLVNALQAGDPFRAFELGLASLYGRGGAALDEVVRDYAIFHGVVVLLCLLAAVLRVRKAALKDASIPQNERAARSKAAVGDNPVLWREMHTRGKTHWLARTVGVLFVLLSFLPLVLIVVSGRRGRWTSMEINVWVRIVGTMVACLLLLAVGVHAAGGITGEQQKQTYDVLLTTTLELDEILSGKWLGALGSIRKGWFWLGTIFGLGVLTGGVNVLALPFLFLCWAVYGSFVAALGLHFSLRCRTTLRAIVATVSTCFGLCMGPVLISSCCMIGTLVKDETPMLFLAGLCPPAAMGMAAFHGDEFSDSHSIAGKMLLFVFLGLIFWTVVTGFIWHSARERFRVLAGRGRVEVRRWPREQEPLTPTE